MNQKAAELGMENTHFVNPSGLHDPEHYTTAYDIYLMAHAAMQYETFRTIVSTARYVVPATNMSGERNLYTTNALIDNWRIAGYTYSKAIGIKTAPPMRPASVWPRPQWTSRGAPFTASCSTPKMWWTAQATPPGTALRRAGICWSGALQTSSA